MFYCEKCKINFASKQSLSRHQNSEIHINGKRKIRKDKQDLSCNICNNYKAKTSYQLKLHILNNHSTCEEKKNSFNHYCEICNVGFFAENRYEKHLETTKHKFKIFS